MLSNVRYFSTTLYNYHFVYEPIVCVFSLPLILIHLEKCSNDLSTTVCYCIFAYVLIFLSQVTKVKYVSLECNPAYARKLITLNMCSNANQIKKVLGNTINSSLHIINRFCNCKIMRVQNCIRKNVLIVYIAYYYCSIANILSDCISLEINKCSLAAINNFCVTMCFYMFTVCC